MIYRKESARPLKPGDDLYIIAMGRNGKRCEARVNQGWDKPDGESCDRPATGAFKVDEPIQAVALCDEHRRMAFGPSSQEKRAKTVANKAAQRPLFAPQHMKKTEG